MALSLSSDVVDDFLEYYPQSQPYWHQLAKTAHDICWERLDIQGIGFDTTFRAKSSVSLRNKLKQFSVQRGGYKDRQEIYDSVPDFAGVCIALYIPNQRAIVDTIIKESFQVVKVIDHPADNDKERGRAVTGSLQGTYRQVFSGYSARHYHVQLREADLKDKSMTYKSGDVIEIQAMSILQYTWAKVEHKIRYKTMTGTPSEEEHLILDNLKAVVQIGDMILNSLYDKYVERKTAANERFVNGAVLGTVIYTWNIQNGGQGDIHIGPVEALLKLLKIYKLDNPLHLKNLLHNMHFQGKQISQAESTKAKFHPFKLGLSIQIMDYLLSTKNESTTAEEAMREEYGEYGYKIRVMMSAIMWLDEFFLPPLKWEEKFSNQGRGEEQEKSLKWFVTSHRLMKILRDGANPRPDEEEKITILWEWFEGHGEEIVKFVLTLAKIGVFKELPEGSFHHFKRICLSLKYLF